MVMSPLICWPTFCWSAYHSPPLPVYVSSMYCTTPAVPLSGCLSPTYVLSVCLLPLFVCRPLKDCWLFSSVCLSVYSIPPVCLLPLPAVRHASEHLLTLCLPFSVPAPSHIWSIGTIILCLSTDKLLNVCLFSLCFFASFCLLPVCM